MCMWIVVGMKRYFRINCWSDMSFACANLPCRHHLQHHQTKRRISTWNSWVFGIASENRQILTIWILGRDRFFSRPHRMIEWKHTVQFDENFQSWCGGARKKIFGILVYILHFYRWHLIDCNLAVRANKTVAAPLIYYRLMRWFSIRRTINRRRTKRSHLQSLRLMVFLV